MQHADTQYISYPFGLEMANTLAIGFAPAIIDSLFYAYLPNTNKVNKISDLSWKSINHKNHGSDDAQN